eukprot:355557-Chlamydomonas_euryale.AAC.2
MSTQQQPGQQPMQAAQQQPGQLMEPMRQLEAKPMQPMQPMQMPSWKNPCSPIRCLQNCIEH